MNRSLVHLTVLCFSLLLVACGGGKNQPMERPLYTGSDGIIMSFPESNALKQYPGEFFTVSVRLLNDGTADINATEPPGPAYITATFDPSVITAQQVASSSKVTQPSIAPRVGSLPSDSGTTGTTGSAANSVLGALAGSTASAADGVEPGFARAIFTALGRSPYRTTGDVAFVEYTFRARELAPSRAIATTPITLQACYPYTTTFVSTICVDRDFLQAGTRAGAASVCNAKTISAQPQGAPVAVRTVTPRYTRKADGSVEARYEITIENIRGGTMLWPGATAKSVDVCDLENLKRTDYGVAGVTAQLSGIELQCGVGNTPEGVARFDRRKAVITCRVPQGASRSALAAGATYEGVLVIQTKYFYIQSLTAQIEVVRS